MGKIEVNSERWLNPKDLCKERWIFLYKTESGRTYYLSNKGRVKLIFKKGKEIILKQYKNRDNGYYKVDIDSCPFLVHRLVARVFVRRSYYWYNEVDHRNGDKTDNNARNLRWVTRKKNANNPITKWERDLRYGLTKEELKPTPTRSQNMLSAEEGNEMVKKHITKRILSYLFYKKLNKESRLR